MTPKHALISILASLTSSIAISSTALAGFQHRAPVDKLFFQIDPSIQVTPSSILIPDTAVGSSSSIQIFVNNSSGTSGLINLRAVVSGSAFSLEDNSCGTPDIPAEVPPNGNCSTFITFTPLSSDSFIGALSFDSSSANPSVVSYPLFANGTGSANISPDKESLAFPLTSFGETSVAQSVLVTNTGTTSVDNLRVSLMTADKSSDVSFDNSGWSASSDCSKLQPSESCTIDVVFSPTLNGLFSATVKVSASSSLPISPIHIGLKGDVAYLANSTSSIVFPDTNLLDSSSVQSVLISNQGSIPVAISNVSLSGASASQFSIVSQTCEALSPLNPGSICSVDGIFRPTSGGLKEANLSLTSNAPLISIPMSGTGLYSSLKATASSVSLPSTAVDTQSNASSPVIISNNGNKPAVLSSISIIGPNSSEFLLDSSCRLGTLALGDTCSISAIFAPLDSFGLKEAAVSLVYNDGKTISIALQGLALKPHLVAGAVSAVTSAVGVSSTSNVAVISNTGNQPATLLSLSTPAYGMEYSTVAPDSCKTGSVINPASSGSLPLNCVLRITGTPQSLDTVSSSITLTATPASSVTVPVALTGTVSDPKYSNVVALLHFDGLSSGGSIIDEKGHGTSIGSGVYLTSASAKFGGISMASALSSSGGLANVASIGLGVDGQLSGEFTIEGWVLKQSPNWIGTLFSLGSSATGIEFTASSLIVRGVNLGNPFVSGLTQGSWHHIAIQRSGSTVRFFLNGTPSLVATGLSSTINNAGDPLLLGTTSAGTGVVGYLDEWRVTKGVARYPAAGFIAPSAPFGP